MADAETKSDGMRPGMVLVERGGLTVRLAAGRDEVTAAQRLRYIVFYEELSARADTQTQASRLDADRFDEFCDQLLVVNAVPSGRADAIILSDGELVGTYRLLRQEVAREHGGFYTQSEFDIAPLIASKPDLNFLELGRSCVLAPYRTKPAVELLWQGIWNYVRLNNLDVMIGCASLEGTDLQTHAMSLSFMAQNCAPPPEWNVRALPHRYVEMNRLPRDKVDVRRGLASLPPLIKGYLRLGCYIGEGAVIDEQFNTIDVLIILPVSAINPRYFAHFGAPDDAPLGGITG
jgi:putative hemolysin